MISRYLSRALLAVAATALVSGAAAADRPTATLAAGYNDFGFALIHQLQAAEPEKNVIVSPASVAIALAMTSNGAASSTRTVMLKLLGASRMDAPSFDAANAALLKSLRQADGDVKFSIANALWLNPKDPPLPHFVATSHDAFGATAQEVPFGDPASAQTINDWVKANTDGLIPSIVDSTQTDDVLVITNALALQAKWAVPFEKKSTHDAPFTLANGDKATVSMMQRNGSFSYAENPTWQIARLPSRGDRFAMYVLLPKPDVALKTAFSSLDATSLAHAAAALTEKQVNFSMPRFTAEFRASLNTSLSKLGMGIAFSSEADFSNLIAPPARAAISDVQHRTFVQVDEDGTKAAAATAVTITTLAVMVPQNVVTMIVDRPFALAIRDETSGQLLFLGTIYKP